MGRYEAPDINALRKRAEKADEISKEAGGGFLPAPGELELGAHWFRVLPPWSEEALATGQCFAVVRKHFNIPSVSDKEAKWCRCLLVGDEGEGDCPVCDVVAEYGPDLGEDWVWNHRSAVLPICNAILRGATPDSYQFGKWNATFGFYKYMTEELVKRLDSEDKEYLLDIRFGRDVEVEKSKSGKKTNYKYQLRLRPSPILPKKADTMALLEKLPDLSRYEVFSDGDEQEAVNASRRLRKVAESGLAPSDSYGDDGDEEEKESRRPRAKGKKKHKRRPA